MLKFLLSRQIDKVEKQWGYDASYMRDLLAADPWAFIRFGLVTTLGHLSGAPAEARSAAMLLATLHEDCGPCTQIGVDVALSQGIAPAVLRAVLAGDHAGMGERAALGYRFARAVLAKDGPAADAARETVERLWGKRAVVALSLAVMAGRMYPTLKFGLGHAKSCSRVTVAGEDAGFVRPEALAA